MKLKSLGKYYRPGSLSFSEGFREPKRDKGYTMVFSLKKAKEIAKELGIKNIEEIKAGLDGDFGENSCVIYDGKWHKYDVYDNSIWATPIILVKFKRKSMEGFECWEKDNE